MHYLITGHTGFKGSWLVLMLSQLGHEVSGISLEPVKKSLFKTAKISKKMSFDEICDIRDVKKLNKKIQKISPDIVIHLAAQPLVRKSYLDPRETIETNVIGTFNVLEAVSKIPSVKANLIITTDKVYKNVNQKKGYIESDHLGGDDPYSASKAASEIIVASIAASSNPREIPVTTVRAGNVIGGGDWGEDRLVPDMVRAFQSNKPLTIRNPNATRPWQHVLDCLYGYVLVAQAHLEEEVPTPRAVNFGPNDSLSVCELVKLFESAYGQVINQEIVPSPIPRRIPDVGFKTMLDSTKVKFPNNILASQTLVREPRESL